MQDLTSEELCPVCELPTSSPLAEPRSYCLRAWAKCEPLGEAECFRRGYERLGRELAESRAALERLRTAYKEDLAHLQALANQLERVLGITKEGP